MNRTALLALLAVLALALLLPSEAQAMYHPRLGCPRPDAQGLGERAAPGSPGAEAEALHGHQLFRQERH